MHLQEIVLCATAAQSTTAGTGSITLYDIQTGASLASFKQTNTGPRSVALFESTSTQGGYMLAAQSDKNILNVYNFQKDQLGLKIVLAEKLTCIAVDRVGNYCAAGTAQGRIYIWETASGILYNTWDAHYRKVNVLKFTNDGSALISGSDDSGVNVWSVSKLLDNELQSELPAPYCTLSDHTLPVTDIICSVGLFPGCRILTSSVDHSVKLWDLSSKHLLTTLQFPQSITSLAWDVTERFIFAASPDGSIHQVNLFRQTRPKSGGHLTEAIGGAGAHDMIFVDDDDSREARKKRLISIGQPVTSLAISLTSTLLLAGTSEGLIYIYDIPSHQLLRTISTHKGFSISYVATMLKPPDLVGHISLDFKIGCSADLKETIPVKPVLSFQRMRDAKSRERHEVSVLLKNEAAPPIDYSSFYESEDFLQEHAYFVQPISSGHSSEPTAITLKSRVDELETEVERLKGQLSEAKGINDAIWDTVVQRLVGQEKEVTNTGEDGEDALRSRKRSRS